MSASDKAQELLAKLHEGVEHLVTGDDWKRALQVQARFHKYSFYNSLLIALQRPDATYVTGYGAKDKSTGWLSLGRQVRKGEKAISILAPMFGRKTVDEVTGTEHQPLIGFRTVSVFDISQTDGDPLPIDILHPAELDGDAPEHLFKRIADFVLAYGYEVVDDDALLPGGAKGVTIPTDKTVTVKSDMSPLARVKTLVHELAHVILHSTSPDFDYRSCRGQAELEAESTAFVVCAALGLPTDDYSFAYVGGWSGGDMELVKRTGQRVAKTARSILDKLEES